MAGIKLRIILLLQLALLLVSYIDTYAQYPAYFTIDNENGLPSNEVYSLLQDKDGMIWLGCDAGLYKYNGNRFIAYKSRSQRSRALTGLASGASGRVYVYSFGGQIFYTSGDSLKELYHSFRNVYNIATDKIGKLWVDHSDGISAYNEQTEKWQHYNDLNADSKADSNAITSAVRIDKDNAAWFMAPKGICRIQANEHFELQPLKAEDITVGKYIIECGAENWLLDRLEMRTFVYYQERFREVISPELSAALKGRKITNIKEIDLDLWICTYDGMLIYDKQTNGVKHLYPGYSFSDCIKDREGNYWLSTLQKGLMRISDFEQQVWNKENGGLQHDIVYRVIAPKGNVYISTINGYVGKLDRTSNKIDLVSAEIKGDIQQLYYDEQSNRLYYTISGGLYYLTGNTIHTVGQKFPSLKAMKRVDGGFILATSMGALFYPSLENGITRSALCDDWSRAIEYDAAQQTVWLATNNGLQKFIRKENEWVKGSVFFEKMQVIGLGRNEQSGEVYSVNFDGHVSVVDNKGKVRTLGQLPGESQVSRVVFYDNKLYCATNAGLWILDVVTGKWFGMNRLSGLSSDNVQDISIDGECIWLATGNGLQKIPLSFRKQHVPGLIYLRKILVDGKEVAKDFKVKLKYGQQLVLLTEVSAYQSNGRNELAYRSKGGNNQWIHIPGSLERLTIEHLPAGDVELEVKMIDASGVDGKNVITLHVNVRPPIWRQWWFYALLLIIVISIAYFIFKARLNVYKKKQAQEMQRIKLENDLKLSQQAALKAQMNPHFIFNVLNSIKSYIYENDKKAAAEYLSKFASLVRMILEMSDRPQATLSDELDALELYIQLEAMLLEPPFHHEVKIDENVNTDMVNIPSLIIQPFIENAFEHGLQHKAGEKNLTLSLSLVDNDTKLRVVITDNGIGRVAAKGILGNRKQHTSFATDANARRLELLNNSNEKIGVAFEDKYDAGGNAIGTQVTLLIRL